MAAPTAPNSPSKHVTCSLFTLTPKWRLVAIAIGGLIVIGAGSFGTLGLLHSYNCVTLPQWLAFAIGTISHTPHFWSLWVLTAGGLSIGAVLITWGVLKANAPRRDDSIQKLLAEDASLKLIKALKENTAPLTYWITTPTPGSRYEQKIEFIDPQGIRNIIQHDFRIGGNSGALPKKKKIRDWLDSQGYRCTNLPKDQALFSS